MEDDLRSLWSSLDVQPAESSSLRVVLEELADELSLDVAVDEIPDVVLRHDPTSELAVVIVELGLTRTEVLDEQLQVDLVVILGRGTASGPGHESSTLLPTVCRTVRDVVLWVDVEVIELMTCILNGASMSLMNSREALAGNRLDPCRCADDRPSTDRALASLVLNPRGHSSLSSGCPLGRRR